jgi:hypothetical protein
MRPLLFIFFIIAIAGCDPESAPAPSHYSGTWTYEPNFGTPDSTFKYKTSNCNAEVSRIDERINITLSNDSTNEVMTLIGHEQDPVPTTGNYYDYTVVETSTKVGGADTAQVLYFARDGSGFNYSTVRGTDIIFVTCNRK